ncbi:transposase [Paenibacillus phocaensis]|uniref:transposase n=1 Tax=Paenibacillus phocaensis TaxID=1776378 RepID=UPI0018E1DA67|nr:transposase [Paenibacillus phocaensis]
MNVDLSANMDLPPLSSRFRSEADCIEMLIAKKWPNGFVCPRCANTACTRLSSRRLPLFECGRCAYQASPLVGTIFERTHLPLLKWFQALELFLLPDGISALRLSQVIRVTYKTAWLMLHKIRHTLGETDARELLSGDVRVSSDQYGVDPLRSHPYATAVVAGCTVTETGEPERVKIHVVSQKRGDGIRAGRLELDTFVKRNIDVHSSTMQPFPLTFRLYLPLWREVRAAWKSLKGTYVALGLKHLQAYLNEYTVRRHLRMSGSEETMREELLHRCVAIPAISYRQLIARHQSPPLAVAA